MGLIPLLQLSPILLYILPVPRPGKKRSASLHFTISNYRRTEETAVIIITLVTWGVNKCLLQATIFIRMQISNSRNSNPFSNWNKPGRFYILLPVRSNWLKPWQSYWKTCDSFGRRASYADVPAVELPVCPHSLSPSPKMELATFFYFIKQASCYKFIMLIWQAESFPLFKLVAAKLNTHTRGSHCGDA